MSETTMPAVEATTSDFDERNSYEFAFHVLPTVAEGEVAGVFEEIKAHITKHGEIINEEIPERIDLAYPIVKHIEGKNRKFTSSYFGWVRFKIERGNVLALTEELQAMNILLRHLLLKLTPLEEAYPFRFHENRKSIKMVTVVDEEADIIEDVPGDEEVDVKDEVLESVTIDEEAEKKLV